MGTSVVSDEDSAKNVSRTGTEYRAYTDNVKNEKPRIGASPIIKKNAVPYNYITQSQAEMLAESLNHEGCIDSLMFGVQWNIACVFIEYFGKLDKSAIENANADFNINYIRVDDYSKLWGNYKTSTFKLDNGFYTTEFGTKSVTWNKKTSSAKEPSTPWMCTTGASEQNKVLNIYDFAGNIFEWTLERLENETTPGVTRGGYFNNSQYNNASVRNLAFTCSGNYWYGARPSLYI